MAKLIKAKQESLDLASGPEYSHRFWIGPVLVAAGIAWFAFYYWGLRADPTAIPPEKAGSPKFLADLRQWNFLIAATLIFAGIAIGTLKLPIRFLAAALLMAVGLCWLTYYAAEVRPDSAPGALADLKQWNYVIALVLVLAGTVLAAYKSGNRFLIAMLLILAGISWITYFYMQVRVDPTALPATTGKPKLIADLKDWNYAVGFGLILLGLAASAHKSTPLGRGRGVVVGMLGCFLFGLLWICTYYVISDDPSKVWVMNDLEQYNLMAGIGFMAVGFAFATKWE
ncbi:cell division protein CrgA [Nocardioides speluncae]|uniref:cell division protein CrgA n=1 Tax=Nocardioides speluncae TaxID=2670337 RepID=UPI000D6934D5|nr:cell division protein CrgA [Nocardioides speluncae]